jgi:hypothetical protein
MGTDFTENDGDGIQIFLEDLVDYLNLYSFTYLLDTHPVRIVIPVVAGFSKAVKLAVALNFAVKLNMGQPDVELLKEVEEVLDFYLHRSQVRQPIDFFHTTLTSFFNDEPISLWEIVDEVPVVPATDLECYECEFFNQCGGYFKWPDVTYGCDGVKSVFRTLANAAQEMRSDLATFDAMEVQAQP